MTMPHAASLRKLLTYGLIATLLTDAAIWFIFSKLGIGWGSFYMKTLWTLGGAAFIGGALYEIMSRNKVSKTMDPNQIAIVQQLEATPEIKQAKQIRATEGKEVASLLALIAATPNQRTQPKPGDIQGDFHQWFDGGAYQHTTHVTNYQFNDGSRANVTISSTLSMTIELKNGTRIKIQQES